MRFSRVVLSAVLASLVGVPQALAVPEARLVGRSVWPADTFTPGPTCGQELGDKPIHGRRVPFVNKQPVQGFSAVVAKGDGTFWLLGDNGFGTMENSDDHLLRIYHMRPSLSGPKGQGPGAMTLLDVVALHDPDRRLAYPITNQFTAERVLTGADLDPESFQRAPDGTWWIGDEFGPFLVHVDATGKVLEAPYALPDPDHPGAELRSPQNPYSEETAGLRLMNALRAHARAHGCTRMPAFSPDYKLLADGDPTTVVTSRMLPGSPTSDVHDVQSLHAAGHQVVPWTVNDLGTMKALLKLGVDGMISDRPDLLRQAVEGYDADGDGKPGDYLDADGLIDLTRFDAQGHRGGRNLRPESTFPAFEAGLDQLMATLETDCVITKDGVAVLSHEQKLLPLVARGVDGAPLNTPIRSLTLAELQRRYVLDRTQPLRPTQTNDLALSPVSVAFAREYGLPGPYAMPSLAQLFKFVRFYERYYRDGAGKGAPDAARRAKNAGRVHFDVETKTGPEVERQGLVPDVDTFVDAMARVIHDAGMAARTQIQSFDHRTLLAVQSRYPALQTVMLLGEDRPLAARTQGEPAPAPAAYWLYDVPWPTRRTAHEHPFRVHQSGGFEGMAIAPDGKHLYPMLEKPLEGGPPDELPIFEFDLAARRYTGLWAQFPLSPKATSVPDFILTGPDEGFVIERDDRQGTLDAWKRIVAIGRQSPGSNVTRAVAADLMRLADPQGLSGTPTPGDIGLGPVFAMPFVTIEGLVSLGPNRLGVVSDNNYPFSVGRHVGSGQPDDSEFIEVRLSDH